MYKEQPTNSKRIDTFRAMMAAPIFASLAWRMVRAAPAGWLHGVTEEGFSSTECSAEFHEPLAREMQLAYFVFVGHTIVETMIVSISSMGITVDASCAKATGYPYW